MRNLTGYCWIIVGLWGVINNAGLCVFAECEWCPLDIYQQLIDVNLTGLIRVTKAFLPLIRRSQGRVVNVASLAGNFYKLLVFMYFPWLSLF
jgi:short-subunit dehydrogenase